MHCGPAPRAWRESLRRRALERMAALFGQRPLHLMLQLLEGPHLDLAHALAADAILLRQLLQGLRLGAQGALLDDGGPDSRRFMLVTSVSGPASLRAISLVCSGVRSPSSMALILVLALRKLKNSFFCAAVVPIFTSDQERRMYSWMAARIHHMA